MINNTNNIVFKKMNFIFLILILRDFSSIFNMTKCTTRIMQNCEKYIWCSIKIIAICVCLMSGFCILFHIAYVIEYIKLMNDPNEYFILKYKIEKVDLMSYNCNKIIACDCIGQHDHYNLSSLSSFGKKYAITCGGNCQNNHKDFRMISSVQGCYFNNKYKYYHITDAWQIIKGDYIHREDECSIKEKCYNQFITDMFGKSIEKSITYNTLIGNIHVIESKFELNHTTQYREFVYFVQDDMWVGKYWENAK